MYTKTTTIVNKTGLHARPASDFIGCASKFKSKITIKKVGQDSGFNAKSIILLLSQALSQGTEIELAADGPDETEAVDALVALIESGFGEL